MKTLQITVSGKVQGVWFRKNTRLKAEALGITGTVTNKPDGTVEIFATGEESVLQEFGQWCAHGEPPAQVQHVEVSQVERINFPNFRIL